MESHFKWAEKIYSQDDLAHPANRLVYSVLLAAVHNFLELSQDYGFILNCPIPING